jgi:hypothetical protein
MKSGNDSTIDVRTRKYRTTAVTLIEVLEVVLYPEVPTTFCASYTSPNSALCFVF